MGLNAKKDHRFLGGRGRDDRIRTCGILVPNQALYQTEPHPVVLFSQQRELLYNIIPVLSTLFLIFFKKFLYVFLLCFLHIQNIKNGSIGVLFCFSKVSSQSLFAAPPAE